MAYGLKVTNNSNELIVDSELFGYHFAKKLWPYTAYTEPDILDNQGGHVYFNSPNGIGASQISGRILMYYFNHNTVKPPLCFIKQPDPNISNGIEGFAGQIRIHRANSGWYITLIQRAGTTVSPILYCFTQADEIVNAPDSTYGLIVRNGAGQPTFDSRHKPLRVDHAGVLGSQNIPHAGSLGAGTIPALDVNTNAGYYVPGSAPISDLIVHAPMHYTACADYSNIRSVKKWSFPNRYHYRRYDTWWCFYRSGVHVYTNGPYTYVSVQYIINVSGHIWKNYKSRKFLGISGLNTPAPAITANTSYPYSNSARNISESNSFLISRASYYD
jgi:hypothetical protein